MRPCRGELFSAASLLNLSTLPAAQIVLAKKGLYTLLKANASPMVGRCRLTVSKPVLKVPMVSALETKI